MLTRKMEKAILVAIVILGLTIRYLVWINPMYGALGLTIYDTGSYTQFGLEYIDALSSMNLTALAKINLGVPPLSMVLTGLSIHAFGGLIGYVQAGLIPPITASALTAIPAYAILRKKSAKLSLSAAALIAFDPYLIQFSAAYLDSIGALFALTSIAYLVNREDKRSFSLAVLFASLAVLTKISFAIFVALYALLSILGKNMTVKRGVIYTLIPAATLLLSPWAWTPSGIQTSITGHMTFNNLPLAPLLGPFIIDVPHSLPWYILTYLGLGQIFWNTLPSITPLFLLSSILYMALKKNLSIPACTALPASAIILTIFLLPRNYWTYSWAGGSVQGILTRQFYPYYFYPTIPFLAPLAMEMLVSNSDKETPTRIVTYPVILTALLSPLTLIMNLGLPYWDFIFTLIYNYPSGAMAQWGLFTTILTTLMLTTTLTLSEIIHRKARHQKNSKTDANNSA